MGLVKCRDCGRLVSDRVSYCPHCGGPMYDGIPADPPRPAPRNNHANSADQHYHPQAHQPEHSYTDNSRRTAADNYTHQQQQQQKGSSGWMGFLISFLVILLLGGGGLAYYYYVYLPNSGPNLVTSRLRSTANSFDELGEFYNGVAKVKRGDTFYFIDTKGNIVDRPEGKNGTHEPDENGLLKVENGGRFGYVNRTTRDTVIPAIYTTLGSFYDGFALATIKYGQEGQPEYQCFYGYVDIKGNHTFLPEHFKAINKSRTDADKRAYIESLPKGISLRALGLPKGVSSVSITRDSVATWNLSFGSNGILSRFSAQTRGQVPRNYRVIDGFVAEMSFENNGEIHRYSYRRQRSGDNREEIFKVGPNGNQKVGSITYSPSDGTATGWTFENLPDLQSAFTDSTDTSGRPVIKRLTSGGTMRLSYY